MATRQELARTALRGSFDVRRKAGALYEDPICVYDFAEKLGLEIWFVAGASFGGMYAKDTNNLFIPAERPAGRKAFTCAHELAHWWFNHGTRVDKLDFDAADHEMPEECLANMFAGYLLMPRHAVMSAFSSRKSKPEDCSIVELYTVACQLGVGYETLLTHMRWSLNLINHSRFNDMRAVAPKKIKEMVLDEPLNAHLVIVDESWHKTAVDLEVGDRAIFPAKVRICGESIKIIGDCKYGIVVEAVRIGLTQAIKNDGSWAAMARVSRKEFNGRGAYRHLEDPDEHE